MNYSERTRALVYFRVVFSPSFLQMCFIQKQKSPSRPTSPPPQTYHLIVNQRKLHPSGLGKLCDTHFAYILCITQELGGEEGPRTGKALSPTSLIRYDTFPGGADFRPRALVPHFPSGSPTRVSLPCSATTRDRNHPLTSPSRPL